MGYQLVFWKQESQSASGPEAQAVYDKLMAGSDVEGLLPVPLDEILSGLRDDFPMALLEAGADSAGPKFWVSEDEQNVIEFDWSSIHFLAEFRPFGKSSHAHANRIIDVLSALKCPLYDPQSGERF